jgi:cyclopropane-fatty-acyl-phospholipid synthase
MNTTTYFDDAPELPRRAPRAARAVLALLERLGHGTLWVSLPDGGVRRFGAGEPQAALAVHDWDLFGTLLARGDTGLAEGYIDGRWSTPSLPQLLSLLVANREPLHAAVYGHPLARFALRLRHLLRRNSRAGSRRNIAAHYDLGNAFYRLWLDGTMNYSAGWYEHGDETLEQAQHAKMRRALREAGAAPGARVLEIGCGWGALAECGAREFGARMTGITLSHEQLAWGLQRLAGTGAELRLQDYRDLGDDAYDAIVSIEMVEAVGREYWPRYFGSLARLLRPGGRACVQSIVIADGLWDRYIRGTDFIQQYVFPGGCLPCPREFEREARAAGLDVVESFAFGADYARTLAAWRERFTAARAEVRALGFDERFIRLWEFYLCYCEAAFSHGNTDVVQYTLVRR